MHYVWQTVRRAWPLVDLWAPTGSTANSNPVTRKMRTFTVWSRIVLHQVTSRSNSRTLLVFYEARRYSSLPSLQQPVNDLYPGPDNTRQLTSLWFVLILYSDFLLGPSPKMFLSKNCKVILVSGTNTCWMFSPSYPPYLFTHINKAQCKRLLQRPWQ